VSLVMVLRFVSLLAFAAPMLLAVAGRSRATPRHRPRERGADRTPLVANLVSAGLHVLSLLLYPGNPAGNRALLLGSLGALLCMAGAALVLRSRAVLGAAWSLAPKADQGTGFVTAGPYRFVRHPIYLGFALLATGQAIAFSSWPTVAVVLMGLVPTFAWRASTEERLLGRMFGEPYEDYRQRTRMMIPYVL